MGLILAAAKFKESYRYSHLLQIGTCSRGKCGKAGDSLLITIQRKGDALDSMTLLAFIKKWSVQSEKAGVTCGFAFDKDIFVLIARQTVPRSGNPADLYI